VPSPAASAPTSAAPALPAGDRDDAFPSTPAPTGPEALADARSLGRPLLVVFAPADDAARADRSRVLDLLRQADLAAARLPLVFAHVVALGARTLEAIAPRASASAPFAVLVETDGRGGALQVVPWAAALGGPQGLVSFDVARRERAREAPATDLAFWDLVHALRSGLVGDASTQARRAAQRAGAGPADAALFGPRADAERRRWSEALPDAWRLRPISGTRWVPLAPLDPAGLRPNPAWCGTPGPVPRGDGWPTEEDALAFPGADGGIVVRWTGRRAADKLRRRPPDLVDAPPTSPVAPLPHAPARLELLPP